MRLLLRWVLNAGVLLLIAQFFVGVEISGFYAALITALILGLVNAIIRPLIILLTLPVNVLTLGLFTFVINALLFWFVSTVVQGFHVDGFTSAFIGALIMTVASWIFSMFLKKSKQ